MKVYAVHDVCRAAIRIYVDLGEREDGTRLYLTQWPRGEKPDEPDDMGRVLEVAPGCEAPHFVCLPLYVAAQVAAAIESPLADEAVTLDTWGDFAGLVERATSSDPVPRP